MPTVRLNTVRYEPFNSPMTKYLHRMGDDYGCTSRGNDKILTAMVHWFGLPNDKDSPPQNLSDLSGRVDILFAASGDARTAQLLKHHHGFRVLATTDDRYYGRAKETGQEFPSPASVVTERLQNIMAHPSVLGWLRNSSGGRITAIVQGNMFVRTREGDGTNNPEKIGDWRKVLDGMVNWPAKAGKSPEDCAVFFNATTDATITHEASFSPVEIALYSARYPHHELVIFHDGRLDPYERVKDSSMVFALIPKTRMGSLRSRMSTIEVGTER